MKKFKNNYLYELPEDIQTLIYKKVYQFSLKLIRDSKEAISNFNKLIEYIKKNKDSNNSNINNQAIWNIILRRDVGEPYYKYFQYYADNTTDFLLLNKSTMIKYDTSYSTIKYIEFSIYPIEDRIPSPNFNYIKNTFEQYIHIFLSMRLYNDKDNSDENNDKYRNIKDIKLLNNKIIVEFRDTYIFRCYIDIYNNILELYNFIVCILDILSMFNNTIYPEYNLDYLNDLNDLREWFKYNTFFNGFVISNKGDTICPFFNS
jgi:hypothetical protein